MLSAYERRRKRESRREFELPYGRITLVFRTPNEVELQDMLGSIPPEHVNSAIKQAATFVPACLVGWKGVVERDLDDDGGDREIPFDEDDIDGVLDLCAGVFSKAYVELMRRYEERRKAKAAEVKN